MADHCTEEIITEVEDCIAKLFKIDSLKEYQKSCLKLLASATDCFICQPTGSGKSIVYQALPFYCHALKEKIQKNPINFKKSSYKILVISPLTSLIKDQIKQLLCLGITATALLHDRSTSHEDAEEESQQEMSVETSIIDEVKKCSVIFTSPEAILGKYRELLKDNVMSQLVAIAVDESHCIKKWGSTSDESVAFRSRYSDLAELRSLIRSSVPVVALTATATHQTRSFIIDNLSLKEPQMFISSPGKENIKFSVIKIPSGTTKAYFSSLVTELEVKCYKAERILIFCRTINDLRSVYDIFDDTVGRKYTSYKKRPFAMFHSQTDEIVKEHIIEQFTQTSGTVRILIATIAFGMGINCKGLNTVIHFSPPSSLEDYIQEAGRAGRDGSPSDAVINIKPRSLSSKNILASMKSYVQNNEKCRRNLLLEEFGCSKTDSLIMHDCCDVCERSCNCVNCSSTVFQKPKPWWKSFNPPEKVRATKKIVFSGMSELRSKLLNFRSNLLTTEGHASSDILSGFPLKSIDEIISVYHKDMTAEELYERTSLLRKTVAEGIILEMKSLIEKHGNGVLGSKVDETSFDENEVPMSDYEDEDSSGSSSDESVSSVEFHVNISDIDD